jgi:hypothetical protein
MPQLLTDDAPLVVFGDPVGSGTFNAWGEYLAALERDGPCTLTWRGTPGAFSLCLAQIRRMPHVRHLEFLSYGERYAALGLPIAAPSDLQPYYPWSIAWRTEDSSAAVGDMLKIAADLTIENAWTQRWSDAVAAGWTPRGDPHSRAAEFAES